TIQVGTTTSTILSSSLSLNSLNIATTTVSPNSICRTPQGLLFVAPDGVRLLNTQGQVENPIGVDGQGVNAVFLTTLNSSRIAAAATATVFRVTVNNNNVPGDPYQEYWFDLVRGVWSGPHTFPFRLIQSWANTFIGTPMGITGQLWQSDAIQSSTSTYIEN